MKLVIYFAMLFGLLSNENMLYSEQDDYDITEIAVYNKIDDAINGIIELYIEYVKNAFLVTGNLLYFKGKIKDTDEHSIIKLLSVAPVDLKNYNDQLGQDFIKQSNIIQVCNIKLDSKEIDTTCIFDKDSLDYDFDNKKDKDNHIIFVNRINSFRNRLSNIKQTQELGDYKNAQDIHTEEILYRILYKMNSKQKQQLRIIVFVSKNPICDKCLKIMQHLKEKYHIDFICITIFPQSGYNQLKVGKINTYNYSFKFNDNYVYPPKSVIMKKNTNIAHCKFYYSEPEQTTSILVIEDIPYSITNTNNTSITSKSEHTPILPITVVTTLGKDKVSVLGNKLFSYKNLLDILNFKNPKMLRSKKNVKQNNI